MHIFWIINKGREHNTKQLINLWNSLRTRGIKAGSCHVTFTRWRYTGAEIKLWALFPVLHWNFFPCVNLLLYFLSLSDCLAAPVLLCPTWVQSSLPVSSVSVLPRFCSLQLSSGGSCSVFTFWITCVVFTDEAKCNFNELLVKVSDVNWF